MSGPPTLISIIVPIYNGSEWIGQCFDAVLKQKLVTSIQLEVCVCNDASTDDTPEILQKWGQILEANNISLKVFNNESQKPKGVGFSKNKAVSVSSGSYLCFQDIDDVMLPHRVVEQYKKASELPPNTLIGSQFERVPENSTHRYTHWANSLPSDKLHLQIYTSHGPTIIMPTWFCHRSLFDRVGGFSEEGTGTPEDLIFFYKHLDVGGLIYRVNQPLLIYTYHPKATTFSVLESTIWDIRLKRLIEVFLRKWPEFTIWNAGKQGRKLYNSLPKELQNKVSALCDVDKNKIGKKYVPFDAATRKNGHPVDILHFKEAKPPFVVCVKIGLSNGEFEENLAALQLEENRDYVLFS